MEGGTRVIGIAGPSCSGKTSVSDRLVKIIGSARCAVLRLDNYYRPLDHLPMEERAKWNFDSPDALDHERFLADLVTLLAGSPVRQPTYDFAKHTRKAETTMTTPAPYAIAEGTLLYHWPEIRDRIELRVYLHADPEECLQRRIERDVLERGRDEPGVRRQWEETVWPMHRAYLLPTRQWAHLALESADPDEAARTIVAHIGA
jgi:uridine kinase